MNEPNSQIDAKEAAKLSGYSTRHIQKLVKTGTLSATRNSGGKYLIDKCEFYRVFPSLNPENNTNNSDALFAAKEEQILLLKEQNAFLKAQLERVNDEKDTVFKVLDNVQKVLTFTNKSRKKIFGLF